jgi:uncharacterized membrane protein YdjX (TVP38/TMEM64 family)
MVFRKPNFQHGVYHTPEPLLLFSARACRWYAARVRRCLIFVSVAQIIDAKAWFIEDLPISLMIYYAVFVLSAIFLIPYGPFCIAMGFVYGFFWGFIIQVGPDLSHS